MSFSLPSKYSLPEINLNFIVNSFFISDSNCEGFRHSIINKYLEPLL